MSIPSKDIAQNFKAKGNDAFKAKEFRQAVDFFTQAIDADPDDAVLYSNRSGAWASLLDWEQALADAEVCVALKPDFAKGWGRKGLAELHLNKPLESIFSFTEGLKRDPTNASCLEGLKAAKAGPTADIVKQQFEIQVALTLSKDPKFAKYMEEDPEFVTRVAGIAREIAMTQDVSKLQLAMTSCGDRRMQEALAKLFNIELDSTEDREAERRAQESKRAATEESAKMKAAEEAKSGPELEAEELKNSGNVAYKSKNFDEAARLYRGAFEKNPSEIMYLNNLAAVHLERKEFDQCLEVTQKALDLRYEVKADFKKVAKIYNRRAACYLRMGDYPSAIEMYKKSLTEDNDRLTRASLRECERAYEKAQEQAYKDPQKAEEHRIKGNDYFKSADYPSAKKEYDEAIKRNPEDPKLYTNRAAAYMQLFEFPSALKDCDKALELDPLFVKAWARKGACHLHLKEAHKALEAYQKGLNLAPESEECRNGYAQTLAKIRANNNSNEADEEQMRRAAADPEIQQILGDPQMKMILESLQEDPQRLMEYMRDERISNAINKLMAAGILRTR